MSLEGPLNAVDCKRRQNDFSNYNDQLVVKLYEHPQHGTSFEVRPALDGKSLKIHCTIPGCGLHDWKCVSFSHDNFQKEFLVRHKEHYQLAADHAIQEEALKKSPLYWEEKNSMQPGDRLFNQSQALQAQIIKILLNLDRSDALHNLPSIPRPSQVYGNRCACTPASVKGSKKRGKTEDKAGVMEYIDLSLCADQRDSSYDDVDGVLMKTRICQSCSETKLNNTINTTNRVCEYKLRYRMCMICRSQNSQSSNAMCTSCYTGLSTMMTNHALHKSVFVASIMALQTTFNCEKVSVDQELQISYKSKSADTDALFVDAVVTFVVGKIRHVFLIEFQNSHREHVDKLIHKFNDMCKKPHVLQENSRFYLICVNLKDRKVNSTCVDYKLEHKLDIIRSWMLVVMQNPGKVKRYSYWNMFYEMHATNGSLNGKMDSPLLGKSGVDCCAFLKNPLYLNSAPIGDSSDWQYCCDPFTVPLLHQNFVVDKDKMIKERMMNTRQHFGLIGDNAIGTCDIFKKIDKLWAFGTSRHCMDMLCKDCVR